MNSLENILIKVFNELIIDDISPMHLLTINELKAAKLL